MSTNKPRPACVIPPLQFPTSGFKLITDPADKFEEEQLPGYSRDTYYPVKIGDVLGERYQVVAKLGYGMTSTVWLCRDLAETQTTYWALKVHVNDMPYNQEEVVYRHLQGIQDEHARDEDGHPGVDYVRRLEDVFTIRGPTGKQHTVFVQQPLGMTWRQFQEYQPGKVFPLNFVVSALNQILYGLNFLHEVAGVVHTDLHAGNLLIGLPDPSVLSELEDDEMTEPTLRKIVDDTTTIHNSKFILKGMGALTICDFGQARNGTDNIHTGIAMPVQYRAPEVILGLPWGKAVDMWSVGMMLWDMLEPKSLFGFEGYDTENPERSDAKLLAAMTAVLGRPSREFLALSEQTRKYWDGDGNWIGPVPLPDLPHISEQITRIRPEDMASFLGFIGTLLSWEPAHRMDSAEAYEDRWLNDYREAVARQEQAKQEKNKSS